MDDDLSQEACAHPARGGLSGTRSEAVIFRRRIAADPDRRQHGDPDELLASIVQGQPWTTKPETEVPARVRALVRVGLAVEPSERYRDMHALLGELEELTKPEAEPLVEDVTPEETPRDSRGGRSRRGIFAVVLGVMLGSLVTALLRGPGETRPPTLTTTTSEPEAVVEVGPVVREVVHLIWSGDLDQASKDWEIEFNTREMSTFPVFALEALAPEELAEFEAITHRHTLKLTHDTLQIARTFVYRAEILEIIDNPKGAQTSARYGHTWATAAARQLAELGEDNADAEDLKSRARQIASLKAD